MSLELFCLRSFFARAEKIKQQNPFRRFFIKATNSTEGPDFTAASKISRKRRIFFFGGKKEESESPDDEDRNEEEGGEE